MKTNFKIIFFLTVILKIYSVLSLKSFLSIDENSLIINSPHYLNLNSIDNNEVLIITKQKLNNSNLINVSLKNETNTNYSKFFILEGIANEVNISKNQENLNLKYYDFDFKNKSILSENNINKLNITNENLTQKNENFPKIIIPNKIEKIDHLLNFSKTTIEQNNNYKDLLFLTSNKTEELIDGMILKNNLSKDNNIVLNLTYIIVNNTNFDVLQNYLNNNSLFINKKNDNYLNSKSYSELNIFYLNKDNQFNQSNKTPIFKTFQIPQSISTNLNSSNSKIINLNNSLLKNLKSENNLFKIENLTNELKENNISKNDMEIKQDNFTFKLTNLIGNNITIGPKKNSNLSQLFKNENIYENKDPWKNILDYDSNLSDDFDDLFEQSNLKKIKNETKFSEVTIKNQTNITVQKKINESKLIYSELKIKNETNITLQKQINESELIYSEIPIYSNKINVKLNSTNDLNSKNNSSKNMHFDDLNKMEQPIIVKRVEKKIENHLNQFNDKQNSPKNERMKQINDNEYIDLSKNENLKKIEYKNKNNLLYAESFNLANNNIFDNKNKNNPLFNDISLGNHISNDFSSENHIIQKKIPNLSHPLTLNQPNIFVNNPNFDANTIINTNEDNFNFNNQISSGNNKNNFINYDYLKPNLDFMNPFFENINEKNK